MAETSFFAVHTRKPNLADVRELERQCASQLSAMIARRDAMPQTLGRGLLSAKITAAQDFLRWCAERDTKTGPAN